jgi:hypothetical protein
MLGGTFTACTLTNPYTATTHSLWHTHRERPPLCH